MSAACGKTLVVSHPARSRNLVGSHPARWRELVVSHPARWRELVARVRVVTILLGGAALVLANTLVMANPSASGNGVAPVVQGANGAAPVVHGASLGLVLLKLGLGMTVVLVLIVVLQKLARRYGRAFTGGSSSEIKVAAQRTLGPKLSLALVEVRGHTLLLGVGGSGVNTLADLSGVPVGSAGQSQHSDSTTGEDEFARELRRRIAELEETQTLEDLLDQPEARR